MTNLLMEMKPGLAAALGTAICWTIGALCFEYSSKKVGSVAVNVLKLYIAFILFTVFSWILRGTPFPMDASGHAWFWLAMSGVVGFVIGDMFLFKALTIIGARMSMLIMALVPPVTAVIGFFILNEKLSPKEILGMAMTLSGVAVVILTRDGSKKKLKHPMKGILFAGIGMLGQALGIILSKYGMRDYNAFSATHIRVIAGIVIFTIMFFHRDVWSKCWNSLRHKSAMGYLVVGAVFGPFVGVYLSLVAIQHTSTGVASTIIAIVPVLIIPFSIFFFKEKINLREIIGAIIAVAGTSLMFL